MRCRRRSWPWRASLGVDNPGPGRCLRWAHGPCADRSRLIGAGSSEGRRRCVPRCCTSTVGRCSSGVLISSLIRNQARTLRPVNYAVADAMTSPTLRSGPRASSGRMCSRIHGPPTSVATRSASSADVNSRISMRCVSSTRTTRAAVAPASRIRGTRSRHACSVSAVSASLRCRCRLGSTQAPQPQPGLACPLFHVGDRGGQFGVVGDGGGGVEGEAADPGPGGFFPGGLQGAVAVVAVALGLVTAGTGGPGAADLSGGDLGFDLGCRLVGGVGLIQPAHPARIRAGRH